MLGLFRIIDIIPNTPKWSISSPEAPSLHSYSSLRILPFRAVHNLRRATPCCEHLFTYSPSSKVSATAPITALQSPNVKFELCSAVTSSQKRKRTSKANASVGRSFALRDAPSCLPGTALRSDARRAPSAHSFPY